MWGFRKLTSIVVIFLSAPLACKAQDGQSLSSWLNRFGLSYAAFFDGPGVSSGNGNFSPNAVGKPSDDGLRFSNFTSIKYKISDSLNLDFQMRTQWVINNARSTDAFQTLRWQSPRLGISGKLLSGADWQINGAFNTDLPYFFPQPLGGGVVASHRTTILTPGLFANFSYKPKGSRWSLFGLLMPRFFVYSDRGAAEPQLSRAGYSPELKNEFILDIAPTLNYEVLPKLGLRFGTELIYSKLILSDWNPLNGSLNSTDIASHAWRLAPIPIQLGLTYDFSEALNLSTFVQGYPIAAQRINRDQGQVPFLDTVSVGMWISGSLAKASI